MQSKSTTTYGAYDSVISWLFSVTFLVIGLLNLFLVHAVPGTFYLLLAVLYFPLASNIFREKSGFRVPLVAKLVIGLVVLWATLAVGDLAEMAGL